MKIFLRMARWDPPYEYEEEGFVSWAFLNLVRNLQIEISVRFDSRHQDILALFKQTLSTLKTSSALTNFQIRLTVDSEFPQGKQQTKKIYSKLTMCRMAAVQEGRQKGMSMVQVEVEFGMKAAEVLKKMECD